MKANNRTPTDSLSLPQTVEKPIELKIASERYDDVYNYAPTAFYTLNTKGEILDLNICGSRLLGRERRESVYMLFEVFITENSKPVYFEFLKKIFEHRILQTCEVALMPDGQSTKFVLLSGIVSVNGNQCLVNAADITERRKAEEKQRQTEKSLIAAERRLEAVLNGVTETILMMDVNGTLLAANQTAAQRWFVSDGDFIGLNYFDFISPELQQLHRQYIQKMISTSSPVRFEGERDGKVFDRTFYPLLEASGQINQFVVFSRDITEQKKTEVALIESEFFFRETQQAAFIGSYKINFNTGLWESSEVLDRIFGIGQNFMRSIQGWLGMVHPHDMEMMRRYLQEDVVGRDIPFDKEYRIIRQNDGAIRWVHGLGRVYTDSEKEIRYLMGTVQDINDRKLKQDVLRKLNLTLAALSKSSHAMSNAIDEMDYLKKVCQIVVEDTDFAMVWIGYAENDEEKTIRPMASAGFKDDYLKSIKLSWDDSRLGHGPTGVAIRTGKMGICNNMITDPLFEPWRNEALKRGFASSVVFPLKTGGETFGAISIYSGIPDSFLEGEIKLLSELASDLANGITTIRLRVAHRLAEKALNKSYVELEETVKKRTLELQIANDLLKKEIITGKLHEQNLKLAEEKYRTIADFTYNWEFWIDQHNVMIYCSPSCERITGYKASEFMEKRALLLDIVHPEDKNAIAILARKMEQRLSVKINTLFRVIRKDGEIRWLGQICRPVYDASGSFIGWRGSNKDVTMGRLRDKLLKTSNHKYELLSRNISDGIFICRNGALEYLNRAFSNMFGYAESELEGVPLHDLVMPALRDKVENFLIQNGPMDQILNIETECLRRDYSTLFVEFLFNYVASESAVYGVVHDITEKKQIHKNIVKAIIQTEEKERTHFSKELHDGLGPLLSAVKLYLQWSEKPAVNKSKEEIIHKAGNILDDALETVKEISNKLSPHLLTYYGLSAALRSFADKVEESSSIRFTIESNATRRFDFEIEAAFYRAMIECINNTIKHANAENIMILLNDTGNQLQILYRDDGIGFDFAETLASHKGLGLFNLQNRIQTIGGTINFMSNPGQGVKYEITVNI